MESSAWVAGDFDIGDHDMIVAVLVDGCNYGVARKVDSCSLMGALEWWRDWMIQRHV